MAKTKIKRLSKTEIRKAAVEYAATGKADFAQFYTTPDCKDNCGHGDGWTCVQVWVAVPTVELEKIAKTLDW